MKKVKLYRPNETFNKNHAYKILVDGEKVAELKDGEEKTIELADNKSCLQAKTLWCGSKELIISDSDKVETVKVCGNKFLNKQMPFIGTLFPLTGIVFFSGNNQLLKNIGIVILSILLLGLIATLTIWKNKWLNVSKE
ncbi:hypothetical protein [uncultured Draconibacterium sp.]|uniref:hypothetical protein n=1 Tax=uncultured Draconibacterium sp. TaxID=1573823 RepID=UPI0029C8108D|nr:hypothetical protein [uncultured Draconibacterium sp.]